MSCKHEMAKKTDREGNLVDALTCRHCGVPLKRTTRRRAATQRRKLLK